MFLLANSLKSLHCIKFKFLIFLKSFCVEKNYEALKLYFSKYMSKIEYMHII